MLQEIKSMKPIEAVTKNIVKSISNGKANYGVSLTCNDIIAKGFSDRVMEDLVSEVAFAMANNVNLCYGIYSLKTKEVISFSFDNMANGKSFYHELCTVVRKYLESQKTIQAETSDTAYDDYVSGEIASNKNISDYIRVNSYSLNSPIINSDSINDFLDFCENKKPEIFNEINQFIEYLVDGYKIKEIAQFMEIEDSRAYYLRKKISELYMQFNPIKRKTITFAKVETTKRIISTDKSGNDIITEKDSFTYKRVTAKSAKLKIFDHVSNAIVYVTPEYTTNNGYVMENGKMFPDIQSNGNEVIIPMENSRMLSYVINMTKKATGNQTDGCTYRKSDYTASGSYGFRYGDKLPGKKTYYHAFEQRTQKGKEPELVCVKYDNVYPPLRFTNPIRAWETRIEARSLISSARKKSEDENHKESMVELFKKLPVWTNIDNKRMRIAVKTFAENGLI